VLGTPLDEGLRRELRAVVHADGGLRLIRFGGRFSYAA
jgi:hypothetical protein